MIETAATSKRVFQCLHATKSPDGPFMKGRRDGNAILSVQPFALTYASRGFWRASVQKAALQGPLTARTAGASIDASFGRRLCENDGALSVRPEIGALQSRRAGKTRNSGVCATLDARALSFRTASAESSPPAGPKGTPAIRPN